MRHKDIGYKMYKYVKNGKLLLKGNGSMVLNLSNDDVVKDLKSIIKKYS